MPLACLHFVGVSLLKTSFTVDSRYSWPVFHGVGLSQVGLSSIESPKPLLVVRVALLGLQGSVRVAGPLVRYYPMDHESAANWEAGWDLLESKSPPLSKTVTFLEKKEEHTTPTHRPLPVFHCLVANPGRDSSSSVHSASSIYLTFCSQSSRYFRSWGDIPLIFGFESGKESVSSNKAKKQ